MKIIDLLNKIANGEEVAKINYHNNILIYNKDDEWFDDEESDSTCVDYFKIDELNDEVEIIEEDKQEPKPITKKDLEAIGYAFSEMRKALQNGWNKSLNNEPFKEDKKIEKLEYWVDVHSWLEGEDLKKGLQEQAKFNENIYFKVNEIIDYINKGD